MSGRSRRELPAAVAGAAVAGALALSTGGQTWLAATVTRPAPLPPVTEQLTGSELAPLVPAGGLVLLAAAAALLAVRGTGRVLVGLLAAVAGGVLGWSGLRTLLADADATAAGVLAATPGSTTSASVQAAWPVLAVVAGLLAAAAGLLTVLRGRGWPGLGRRHERPAATGPAPRRERSDEDRALDAWRALDRGEDPTEERTEQR
ncbi:Trp biosynthesis-associated membrane protein [Geodermatophilus sp. DSM 44513]|uniref:Trp biosynthesis-associated membrane protein n=1 Tax=Geodermatophilus sp. DSM 44513 TaxID=1528104 RepID=UPI00126C4646|nr:Trp biosynthesis-associated membrane protein [Geodermatophilus sp. DSM 44513]WNV77399.1 Trp biosynthesis-associated membrane protein [Geodermatophilus sp. DSM 44513]